MGIRLPDPPRNLPPEAVAYLRNLVSALEQAFSDRSFTKESFKTQGTLTPRYTIDVGTATLTELREYVATLVEALRKSGKIS